MSSSDAIAAAAVAVLPRVDAVTTPFGSPLPSPMVSSRLAMRASRSPSSAPSRASMLKMLSAASSMENFTNSVS
ncbi:hypothetical protein D3C80_1591460 [compost metagenome]